ncbi:MAG: outer membrane beta-barrel protein [Flavisolibacter sp.]|nr:outer membrane beta-barrel protein [Flavisolibacter sp.]
MQKFVLLIIVAFISISSYSQMRIGVFGGVSHYQGDLVDQAFPARFTKGAFGLSLNYEFTERLTLRTGLTFAKIAGDDKYNNKEYLRFRNLSFESNITELSILGEYNIFNLSSMRWSPYVFGGVALFKFNPYTFDSTGEKFFLKPLSTEGQGLDQYPERKPYSLTQVSLPFGGGIKFALSETINIGLEAGIRKTFTDYLDDVSTDYADEFDLLTARGPKAVELAYRSGEVPGGDPFYPQKGSQRGGADMKDWYYFTGLHVSFKLGSGPLFGGSKRGYGCPKVPQ